MTWRAIVPAYLVACLLLGGASTAGFIANFLLQLAGLPLIGWALWRISQEPPPPQARIPLALLALFVSITLAQFIPLPPEIWTKLPGRAAIADGYRLLDIALPWSPLTLTPEAAVSSVLWLLPAVATLLGVIVLGAFRERGIAVAIVAVTIVSIGIGTLQVAGGASAYFYRITNHGVAVGVFANANHNATLLLVCIPFMAALQQALLDGRRSPHSASAIRLFAGAVFLVILTGLLINGSLAGLGLGVPVALVTGLMFCRIRMRDRHPLVRRGMVVATLLVSVAAIVAIVFGPFGNNLFGEQTSNAALSRQTSFALTYRAALEYFPVGSGIGSFQPIYRMQEPLASVGTTFMNHAHNDWLELLLETGAVGIALTASFLTWWLVRVRMIWRAEVPDPFAQAASIATAVMMLHSFVDYPLRTAALSVAFAACLGLMSGARPHRRKQRVPPSTRHLTL